MLRRLLTERRVLASDPIEAWQKDFPSLFGRGRTAAGKEITYESSLTLVAVQSCVSLISDGVATLPVDEGITVGGKRKPVERKTPWVERPNAFQTPVAFWGRVVTSLALDGNAFIFTIRDERGVIQSLYCIDPRIVEIVDVGFGETRYRIGGAIDASGKFSGGQEFDRSQILHIPFFVMPGNPRGLSPIDLASEAIALGVTAEEYGSRFFQQGTTMAGVIEHPQSPKPDEAKMLRDMFRKTHAGTKNSHAVGILTGGATFKPITISPEQAQFLETRRFQNHQIALLYHIPTYMVDPTVTSSWGSGIEEQNKSLIENAFMPYIVRIEQAVSTFLLGGNRYMKFNLDARLRPNTKERYEAYAIAVNNGWMNLDEVRALEDMEPIPDGKGQDFYRPLNHALVGAEAVASPQNPIDADAQDVDGTVDQDGDPETTGEAEGRSIIVNVQPPNVELHMDNKPRTRRVIRDANGEISEIIED